MAIINPPSAAALQAARLAAVGRYTQLGRELLATIGLEQPTAVRKTLSGRAGRRRDGSITLTCPWPTTTRRRLYIAAHEVAHIVLHYHPDGTRITRPSHVKEFEAERWAHQWMRSHGVPVPRKDTARAKNYVRTKIRRAIKNGAKAIDAKAAKYAGMLASLLPRHISKQE